MEKIWKSEKWERENEGTGKKEQGRDCDTLHVHLDAVGVAVVLCGSRSELRGKERRWLSLEMVLLLGQVQL